MSVRKGAPNSMKSVSVSVVLIMLLLGTTLTTLTPSVEASTNGDASITDSSPSNNSYVSRYDPVYFEAKVTNNYNQFSDERTINWYICEGIQTSNSCYNTKTSSGTIDITSLAPLTNQTFTTDDYFSPNGYIGIYTVVYQFDQFDLNPSNDILKFYINSTDQYVDIKIDSVYDITSTVDGLNIYDGNKILNSNKTYDFSLRGFSHTCTTCSANATIGWQLLDPQSLTLLNESYSLTEMLPNNSYYSAFEEIMPTFAHNDTGEFILRYGIFQVNSTPNDDMIIDNNIHQRTIIINDNIDLSVKSISPAHNQNSQDYLYGEDMLRATFKNNGDVTIDNILPEVTIFDSLGSEVYSSTCLLVNLRPNDEADCLFDLLINGNGLTIEVSIDDVVGTLTDVHSLDNSLQEISNINIPIMNSFIIFEEQKDWYTDVETINITANSNPYSLKPLNYTWWYSGLINIAYGDTVSIDASSYGLGSHSFKMTSRDSIGNVENVYFNIEVRNQFIWSDSPFTEVNAITQDESEILHERMLPKIGESYNLAEGYSPLLLLSYDLQSSNTSVLNGDNWLEISINSVELLPSSIDFESMIILDMEHKNSTYWNYFIEENDVTNSLGNISLRIYKPTTILISGILSAPIVEAQSFNVSKYKSGGFEITWNPQGELENDYFGGWNIYRKTVYNEGGTVFPVNYSEENKNLWDSLTENNLIATVSPLTSSIIDFENIGVDYCASFAIIPFDRSNKLYFEKASVIVDNLGLGTYICSDSEPPSASIDEFTHSWEFTNDTECYKILNDWSRCYQLELTWTWPTIDENNISWNLYRPEQNPNSMDLELLDPIASFIDVKYGTQQSFIQTGLDDNGIRPYQTYFYILTPLDLIGNERSLVTDSGANVEKVHIDDDWWSFNQHLVPEPEPEPEPPLGVEWLGDFSDSLENEEFRIAGIVTIVMLCFSVITLAFIFKQIKRFRNVVEARKRQSLTEAAANEFDDFFE